MIDSSTGDRPRVGGSGASAAPNGELTLLRSEVAVVSSALGDAGRTVRRQQLALVVLALLLDSQLAFLGDDLHSRSNGPGRVLKLFGIAVLVVGVVIALAASRAIRSASPDRRTSRLLRSAPPRR